MPLLLVLSMLSLSMCTGIQSANNRGRLTLITTTPKLVEGKYFSGDRGIHFISKDGGISITMMDKDGDEEEPLFIVSKPAGPNVASFASILGHQFLLVNTSGDGLKEYGNMACPLRCLLEPEQLQSPGTPDDCRDCSQN